MSKYNHKKIEAKWQKYWQSHKTFFAKDFSKLPKKYVLTEFPYPSGEGLHMGHLRPYVAGDVFARFNRLKGFETLFPMGWDAFGLPAENYAIKTGVNPAITTKKNISNAKKQMQSWGLSFDWSREINSTDPNYYKWTQWLFLQFYKAGLAYEATGLINWCPKDKTALANEEVIDGRCERCGTLVEKKELRQWYLKITAYAEKLLEGLKHLPEWPEAVKTQQANWIGKSLGAEIEFGVKNYELGIKVFTTRPDTIFGATYLVVAPESQIIEKLKPKIENWDQVQKYKEAAEKKTEVDRSAEGKEKTGIELKGVKAINPATKEEITVWVADYVLGHYGTGAVMAVPAHDVRDFEFAKKYNLEIRPVVAPADPAIWNIYSPEAPIPTKNNPKYDFVMKIISLRLKESPYLMKGFVFGSGQFDGLKTDDAIPKMAEAFGKLTAQYKLRDWVFSRQRYWGEPIPIIHCPKCGIVPVPEKDLPVKLPPVKKYQPTGTGESPLASITKWVNVKCPKCKTSAKRETNTMPQWAGSSWYWLRYVDPKNSKEFSSLKKQKYWTPVDVYFGGMEHTTLHLLYSRFWNLFLYDQKLVTAREPYVKRVPHGIVLGPDGEKMSKSRGNVVNPDKVVKEFGADTLRMFELFLGPHGAMVSWNDQGVVGVKRFLDRVWYWVTDKSAGKKAIIIHSDRVEVALHRLIKKVTEDLQEFGFNTCISAFMEFHNKVKDETISLESIKTFLILLYPFAPHICEELNQMLGGKKSLQLEKWPKFDPAMVIDQFVEIIVQINGKVKGKLQVNRGSIQAKVQAEAMELPAVKQALLSEPLKRAVFVPNRLLNLVI